jgi:hypothetical protein
MLSVREVEVENDLAADPRWQLIERVISSASFQRSGRLRDLLQHLTERSLHGRGGELTEQRVGQEVFGKPADYRPNEDSSVRVHARQLRLKLHEYFDGEGRNEALIVEIPKGNYVPIFSSRPRHTQTPEIEVIPEKLSQVPSLRALPWVLTAVLTLLCVGQWYWPRTSTPAPAPWPLSEVFRKGSRTQIVVADVNYGLLRSMSQKAGTLGDYLMPDYPRRFAPSNPSERESRILRNLDKTRHASYADIAIVTRLLQSIGDNRDQVFVRSARDVNLRELEEGNYVLLGSPASNPWVSLFEKKLNFRETEEVVGQDVKSFLNNQPQPREQKSYHGLNWSATGGDDYAAVALLPNGKNGNVLILQGLHGEGTEGAGMFLTESESQQQLREAVGIREDKSKPVYFEALLRTAIFAGAPKTTKIAATRVVQP